MSRDILEANRQVKFSEREWGGAIQLGIDFGLGNTTVGVRTGVKAAVALNNARRLGYMIQIIGSDGRKFAYDVYAPKLAYELDKHGERTGKSIDLIGIVPRLRSTRSKP